MQARKQEPSEPLPRQGQFTLGPCLGAILTPARPSVQARVCKPKCAGGGGHVTQTVCTLELLLKMVSRLLEICLFKEIVQSLPHCTMTYF